MLRVTLLSNTAVDSRVVIANLVLLRTAAVEDLGLKFLTFGDGTRGILASIGFSRLPRDFGSSS